jgi:hypothetical protein
MLISDLLSDIRGALRKLLLMGADRHEQREPHPRQRGRRHARTISKHARQPRPSACTIADIGWHLGHHEQERIAVQVDAIHDAIAINGVRLPGMGDSVSSPAVQRLHQ